jgi:predicted ATPase
MHALGCVHVIGLPTDHALSVQMLIKGIRSFSPDNQNVIEFYKPLTLIVGSNGAGKTVSP